MVEPTKPVFAARNGSSAESSGQWRIIDPLTLHDVRSILEPLLSWAVHHGLGAALGDLDLRHQSLALARLMAAIEASEATLTPRVALGLYVAVTHPAAEAAVLAGLGAAFRAAGLDLRQSAWHAAVNMSRGLEVRDARDLVPPATDLLGQHGVIADSFAPFPTIELTYPQPWCAPVHPLAATIEARVERSFHELGLLQTHHGSGLFRDLAVAEYGGWACPTGGAEELFTVMAFLALWIFHDDALEGLGTRAPEILADAVAGALPLDHPACADSFVHGWALLGLRLRRRMSPTWTARHRQLFLEWVESVSSDEAKLLRLFRRVGRPPSTEEYLEARRITIGMVPTLSLVEYVLGVELPESITRRPEFTAFGEAAADAMAIHNDMFGLSKDSESETINLVACRARELGSLLSALVDLSQAHSRAIARMVQEGDRLLRCAGPHSDVVDRWLTGAGQLVSGLARWHTIAPRYSDLHRLAEGRLVRIATITSPKTGQ